MTTQTEALKLALEALSPWAGEDANHTEQYAAYHAIREALAEQPAQQEPVAQCTNSDSWNCKYCHKTEVCEALKDPRNFGQPKVRTGDCLLTGVCASEGHKIQPKEPEQEPVARLHITETDTYPDVDVEVLDGAMLQPSMSPVNVYTTPPPVPEAHKRKPLTDEQIRVLYKVSTGFDFHGGSALTAFIRAIEAAHGIKEKNTK